MGTSCEPSIVVEVHTNLWFHSGYSVLWWCLIWRTFSMMRIICFILCCCLRAQGLSRNVVPNESHLLLQAVSRGVFFYVHFSVTCLLIWHFLLAFRRGGPLPDGVSVVREKLAFGRALRLNDSGVYECEARNGMGVGKAEYTLNIAGKCVESLLPNASLKS